LLRKRKLNVGSSYFYLPHLKRDPRENEGYQCCEVFPTVRRYRSICNEVLVAIKRGQWQPAGLVLPENALNDEDGISSIIRITGGNFRLLQRLLTQIARVLELNGLRVGDAACCRDRADDPGDWH